MTSEIEVDKLLEADLVEAAAVEDGAAGHTSARTYSPWVVMGVILVGSYAAVLNMTVVGVALPAIATDLGIGAGGFGVDWVITSFLVGVVVVQPLTGWLVGAAGRKRAYAGSLVVFAFGAFVCMVAPNMGVMVAGRFVQGLGGGVLIPVGMATVFDLFPVDRRGTAMGIWGVAIMAGPAAGPPLGGWLVTTMSWRWIFGVFTVVAMAAVILVVLLLADRGERHPRRLDITGWTLAATGVVLVVVGARQVGQAGSLLPLILLALLAAAIFISLVRRSLHRIDPIVEFRMFAAPAFAAAMAVVGLLSIAQFARLNFLPIELQVVRGLDAQQVGAMLGPAAFGAALSMPIGGWLADRVGARIPATLGLGLTAVTMWQLAHLQADGSNTYIVMILVMQSIGTGLVLIPTTVAAMSAVAARFTADAAAVNALNRQLAGAVGIAILSAVVVSDIGAVGPTSASLGAAQSAYNNVFLIAFWFVIAAGVAALVLPGRRRLLGGAVRTTDAVVAADATA